MLNKILIICSFTLSTFVCLHADEQSAPVQLIQKTNEIEIPAEPQLKNDENVETSPLVGCSKCGPKKLRKVKPAATETEQTPVAACAKCGHKKKQKDLNAGVLVCNGKEDKCIKTDNKDNNAPASTLFADFCDDAQDEQNLLACKDCQ